MLAKAELHVHLEGTAPPELVRHIAARNGVALPDGLFDGDGRFRYTDFLHFLRTYDLAASVMRTGEDYRDITYEYLCGCARGGAIYVELTASPDHAALVGMSDEEHLDGIARGIVLDTCPTSNVVLGVYPSYEQHPLPQLLAAGVKVTLGSDDPPYFGATIESEYDICAERMGISEDDLSEITHTAIDAAFCDEHVRAALRARL